MKRLNQSIATTGIAIMALFVFLTGCSEVISLDIGNVEGQVVIFGRVINGLNANKITISTTAGIDVPPRPLPGAQIWLEDDQGNREQYIDRGEGEYQLMNNVIVGVSGRSYFIDVTLPDGRNYQSVPEVMPRFDATDSLYFELGEEKYLSRQGNEVTRSIVNIFADTRISDVASDHYFKWDIEETSAIMEIILPLSKFPFYAPDDCYLTNPLDLQNVRLHNGVEFKRELIQRQLIVAREIDDTFRSKVWFSVIRQSLPQDLHRYWSQIDEVANQSGGLFDRPPATVVSNLFNVNDPDEKVLGYFQVTAADTTRIRLSNDDIPLVFGNRCPQPEIVRNLTIPSSCFSCLEGLVAPSCIDCTRAAGSSLIRPYFFE